MTDCLIYFRLILFNLLLLITPCVFAADLPVYDAHIHYSEDVWDALPEKQAIGLLRENGIAKALVSATPAEGALKLYKEAPELVLPMLRPYKSWRHRYYWFKDDKLESYLNTLLAQAPFVGFGEFHVFGEDADLPMVQRLIDIANQRQMVLHAHTDIPGITHILNRATVPVIWAHGGFDVPVAQLRRLLDNDNGLYIELSYREGIVDSEQVLTEEWRDFFTSYPERFLLGMDTYKPSRWAELPELVDEAHHWLRQLPDEVADLIARKNFARLFGVDQQSP